MPCPSLGVGFPFGNGNSKALRTTRPISQGHRLTLFNDLYLNYTLVTVSLTYRGPSRHDRVDSLR